MTTPRSRQRHARAGAEPCRDFQHAWRGNRRQLLQAGSLGLLGLGLPQLWQAQARAARPGKAKSCILVFMWGGPSQLDTFDLKPAAPAEVRGEFNPIDTVTPGVQICEHFQQLAQHTDKLAIIRSLHHNDPAHLSSGHLTVTGNLAPVVKSDAEPPSDRDTPHIGSVFAHLRPGEGTLPPFVTMPWLVSHPAAPGGQAPGQTAGWLGKQYDPMVLAGDPNAPDWQIQELTLPQGVSLERLNQRRRLLQFVDEQRAAIAAQGEAAAMGDLQQRAFSLLSSPEARRAFDINQEPDEVRERYGRNIHGQSMLLARRLVEHGVGLVAVNWHNDGRNFWDTHGDNFNRLKRDLIPPADAALTALLTDLEQRGLLDETIVAWTGEFGRNPQISAQHAGREHWPFCYSGLLAGGGIRGGQVYGSSDKHAAYPLDNPVTPQDYTATIYQALGIDPDQFLTNRLNRPVRICEGQPLPLFG